MISKGETPFIAWGTGGVAFAAAAVFETGAPALAADRLATFTCETGMFYCGEEVF
jgi:hypothetical protein